MACNYLHIPHIHENVYPKYTREMMIRGKVYRFPHILDPTRNAHSRQELKFRLLKFINFFAKISLLPVYDKYQE